MTDLKLPELPVSPHVIGECTGHEPGDWRTWTAYTEAHMQAYATAAVLAERERVAKDAALLDALGSFVEAEGGLVLHTGVLRGNYGGLWVGGGRTLRDALRSCFPEAGGGDDAR